MGTILVLVILTITIGTIWVATKSAKINTNVIAQLSKKLNLGNEIKNISSFEGVTYLGGHPFLPNSGAAIISVRENGIVIVAGRKAAGNTFSGIKAVDFLSQDQVSRDITLTRLLTLGVFAFGLKKKRVDHKEFIRISFEVKGIENTILLQAKSAAPIVSAINSARIAAVHHVLEGNSCIKHGHLYLINSF